MQHLDAKSCPDLATFLERRRGLVTRRWLRAIRADPKIAPAGRLTTRQLIDALPSFYAELCAALRGESPVARARLEQDARKHGRERWLRGYQLDELFCELDDFQRCVQDAAREYFAALPAARAGQVEAHKVIENLFSATIYEAIRQLLAQQEQRIIESLTARDRALSAQHKSDERLRMAAAAARLGIFEWDIESPISVWENERMYEITGQPFALGPLTFDAFLDELVHPEDRENFVECYSAAHSNQAEFHCIFRVRRINDRAVRVVDMHGRFRTGLNVDAEASFIGTLEDITRRVADEDALREANRRKDAFLATLAHELRNPLAPIKNAAQILKMATNGSPMEIQWTQAVIERQCDHLTNLINDLLDISRITTGHIQLKRDIVDLSEVIARAIEINKPAADAHADSIRVTLPDARIFVHGDMTRLIQIISNLLDNAIKYSQDGSDIAIVCDVRDVEARVAVRDSGIGIQATHLEKVFEPYMQVTPLDGAFRSGLGIGLAVVQRLVQMHGGTVFARSDGLGTGSEFVVVLPLHDKGS
ncbi:MAG TPA: ATP-binding protein [Trinickia sp.]|uniref:sensor histidine kinase n=1 Tax=Trinickia sp. TaxID=2571163 RepID=UPI002CDEC290|nr:ATP-binding protein [Trinickia sp.]HTI17049.1 ATP-binding protein [Trinickia sp.]